jgi:hypothetical protein
MRHSTQLVMGLLLVVAAGCNAGSWQREEMIIPGNLPREQQIKIWSGDTVYRWHAAIYTRDSITGIPATLSTTCDSCRIALARYAVDSIYVSPAKVSRSDATDENDVTPLQMLLILFVAAITP